MTRSPWSCEAFLQNLLLLDWISQRTFLTKSIQKRTYTPSGPWTPVLKALAVSLSSRRFFGKHFTRQPHPEAVPRHCLLLKRIVKLIKKAFTEVINQGEAINLYAICLLFCKHRCHLLLASGKNEGLRHFCIGFAFHMRKHGPSLHAICGICWVWSDALFCLMVHNKIRLLVKLTHNCQSVVDACQLQWIGFTAVQSITQENGHHQCCAQNHLLLNLVTLSIYPLSLFRQRVFKQCEILDWGDMFLTALGTVRME